MIYLDHNLDRNCQWSDITEETQQEAARAMLEQDKFIVMVNGQWCKLEKQETTFLEEILRIETEAPTKREEALETMHGNDGVSEPSTLGTPSQMILFRDLVKEGMDYAMRFNTGRPRKL